MSRRCRSPVISIRSRHSRRALPTQRSAIALDREQRLRDAGMLTLAEIAAQLGVSTGTNGRVWIWPQ